VCGIRRGLVSQVSFQKKAQRLSQTCIGKPFGRARDL
jgi:hypothetical protein